MRLGRLIFGFSFDLFSFPDADHFSFDRARPLFFLLLTVFDRISFSNVLTARLGRSRGGGLWGFAGVAVRHGHVVGHDVGAQVTQSVSDLEGSDSAFRGWAIGDLEISDSQVSDSAIRDSAASDPAISE